MDDPIKVFSDGSFITFPASADNKASDWMRLNLLDFGDYLEKEVLWLPGSHDAGMYTCQYFTPGVNEGHVLTQRLSIYDQLRCGIRWFDIRPMLTENGQWYCGHFSSTTLGWKGGLGCPLPAVIGDVNRFLREHAELVVLDVSHVLCARDGAATSREAKMDLISLLKRAIPSMLTYPYSSGNKNISDLTLNQLIGQGAGITIVFLNDDGDAGEHPENNFDTNVMRGVDLAWTRYVTDGVYATVQQTDFQAVFSTIGRPFGFDSTDVLSLAAKLPSEQFPYLAQDMVKYATTSAGSRNTEHARIAQFDDIHDADPLTFTLAATFAEILMRQPEKFDPPMIAVYGAVRVTEIDVLKEMYSAAMSFRRYAVSNSSMRFDPWPGCRKSCVVYVLRRRQAQSNAASVPYLQARYAREGEELNFGIDVNGIDIGKNGQQKSLSEMDFNIAYANLFRAISARSTLRLDFSGDGSTSIGIRDPAPGERKDMLISYRSAQNNESGRGYEMRRFVEYEAQQM